MFALPLPDALCTDLESGRPIPAEQKARLGALFKGIEKPFPDLYNTRGIQRENQLWTSPYVHLYLGQKSEIYTPGNIDPHLALIIGQAEPDGPIALDYRVEPPRVVYLTNIGTESYWIELAKDYEHLIATIT